MLSGVNRWLTAIGGTIIIVGGFAAGVAWIGVPPFAAKADLQKLAIEVAANTEASLRLQLRNALVRGDREAIDDLCDLIRKLYGYTPRSCG